MSHSMGKFDNGGPNKSEATERFCALFLDSPDCDVLRQLESLKVLGWSRDDVHNHFQAQQARAAAPETAQTAKFWLRSMCNSIRQMDQRLHFIPPLGRLRFLDIGCAPGGYSQYVLLQNPQAEGVGITLPANDGGHFLLIPRDLTQGGRYRVHFKDVTTYDLIASFSTQNPHKPFMASLLPFTHSSFELVILDGHVLRTRPRVLGINRILLFTQLIIGLQSVTQGGTIFIKMSKTIDPLTARLIFLLDSVTKEGGSLVLIKPKLVHVSRGTFYAVAKGIQKGELLDQFVQSLYQVLKAEECCYVANQETAHQLGGTESQELTISMELLQEAGDDVLDAIVPRAKLEDMYISRLTELLKPVWEVQRDGMLSMLRKNGVDI